MSVLAAPDNPSSAAPSAQVAARGAPVSNGGEDVPHQAAVHTGCEAGQPHRIDPASGAPLLWLATALVATFAIVVQPAWPVRAVQMALWAGGAWRALFVPLCWLATLAALFYNSRRPGTAWSASRSLLPRLLRWLAALFTIAVFVLAGGAATGLLAPRAALRAVVFLVMQVALFPGTPAAALLLGALVALLLADRHQVRAISWVYDRFQRRPRQPERALWRGAPAGATWLLGAAIAAALFSPAMQGWGHADGPDAQRFNLYTSFFNFSYNDDHVASRAGFDFGGCGLALAPGATGSITFQLERTPESLVFLKPNFYNLPTPCQAEPGQEQAPPGTTFHNLLELSTDQGRTFRPVVQDATIGQIAGDATLDLTPLVGASRDYQLRFTATNTTPVRVTVLPSFVASVVVDPEATPHALFPVVPYLGTVALLVYFAARRAHIRPRLSSLAGGAVALAAGALALLVAHRAAPNALDEAPIYVAAILNTARAATAIALLALACLWLARRLLAHAGHPAAPRVPWLALACVAVSLVGLDLRWSELMRLRYEFLLPDAQGYQAIAVEFPRKMEHYRAERYSELLDQLYAAGFDGHASAAAVFYAGGNNGREPLWPALLRLTFNLLGVSAFHTRLTSLVLSVLVVGLTCWIGWRALHPLVGVTAGLVAATSPPLVGSGVAGLREDSVSLLFACALATLFVGARRGIPPEWWRIAIVGLAAGGVVLVRADMVIMAGVMVTLAALAFHWPWRCWLATGAVIATVAGPMYVGYAFTHHDPFYPGTYGATVNRNLEFPERMGTPGFPTPEEYATNWGAGPTISPMKYFFGYHTPGQFIAYTLRGFARIFREILFVEWQKPLFWLFVVGMALLALLRRWLIPAIVVVALVPFYAFLAGVPNPWVFAPRYAYHVIPYAAMAVAFGLWGLPIWLGTTWRDGRVALKSR